MARRLDRRHFVGAGFTDMAAFLWGCGGGTRSSPVPESPLGPLAAPDANGVRLPAGFASRIVARSQHGTTGKSGGGMTLELSGPFAP